MTQLRNSLSLAAFLLFLTTQLQGSLTEPCDYSDTVNLTGFPKYPNGSYLYGDTLIPADLVGMYEYIANATSKRIPVDSHPRGCICKLKSCVQFCCPPGQKYHESKCLPFHGTLDPLMNITTSEDKSIEEDIQQKFAIQVNQPCLGMYYLEPHNFAEDEFKLFENGTLFRLHDEAYISKDDYCLGTATYDDNATDFFVPLNCLQSDTGKTKTMVYAYFMLFSVPFMIVTIIVYTVIPELRTLHGKSLSCYLLGLSFGYTILSLFNLLPHSHISEFSCTFWGFVAYYAFMASFFWLSVISFDLYYNIRAPGKRFNAKKRFMLYSTYAWGMAAICLALTISAQEGSWISYNLKPGIGSAEFCFLNVKYGWSALIYFYAPVIVIICFNLTMFILTALQINALQKPMGDAIERRDSQRNISFEKDRFGIFLRLFIVMGVTWSMEIISYFIGQNSPWNKLFYITDICNGIQGFLIFALFVLKKKVRRYIANRIQGNRKASYSTTASDEMNELTQQL